MGLGPLARGSAAASQKKVAAMRRLSRPSRGAMSARAVGDASLAAHGCLVPAALTIRVPALPLVFLNDDARRLSQPSQGWHPAHLGRPAQDRAYQTPWPASLSS